MLLTRKFEATFAQSMPQMLKMVAAYSSASKMNKEDPEGQYNVHVHFDLLCIDT